MTRACRHDAEPPGKARFLLAAALCLATGTWRPAAADDWPQWLGPNRDGISTEKGASRLLPAPVKVWTAQVGLGPSSPVVSKGRVFVMGHAKGAGKRGTDTVLALDAATGAVAWTHSYECLTCQTQDVRFDGPRSTPTVHGEAVYTLSLEGHLFSLDASSGKVLWSKRLTDDLKGGIPVYGYCCSPLVHERLLILELNAHDASYVALDSSSGSVVWKLAGGQVTCGSPVLTTLDGARCAVFSGGGIVMGVEASTGKELWRHSTWGHMWMGPVVSGKDVFIANASLPRGCGLIRVEQGKPRVLWEDRKKFQTLHSNSVIVDGHIYGFDNAGTDYQGTDSKKSSLKCIVVETGEVKWAAEKMGWGNLIVFDGQLIILREAGELIVAEATPEACRVRLRAPVLGGKTWAVPALAAGRLYVRNNAGELACLKVLSESK